MAGISLGLTLLAASLAIRWYESRPREWVSTSVSASFESVNTESPQKTLVFTYVLKNNTDQDYTLDQGSGIKVMARRVNPASLSAGDDGFPKVSMPVFVPAHQQTRITVYLGQAYSFDQRPKKPSAGKKPKEIAGIFTSEALRRSMYPKNSAELIQFIQEELPNLDGFAIFDEGRKYQIVLPRGW